MFNKQATLKMINRSSVIKINGIMWTIVKFTNDAIDLISEDNIKRCYDSFEEFYKKLTCSDVEFYEQKNDENGMTYLKLFARSSLMMD